jgi:heme oxygenase
MTQNTSDSMQGSVHGSLRAATRGSHASIDRMLLPLNFTRADEYRMFLKLHLAALVALEVDWRPQDGEDFAGLLRCLRADLEALGIATTAPPLLSRTPTIAFKGLGVGYVVRGSRLGAAILRRGVARDFPTAYLDFVPKLSWAAFLAELESIADDPNGRDQVTRAAQSTFNTFAAEFTRLQDVVSTAPPE